MDESPTNLEPGDIRFRCFTARSPFDQAGGSRFSLLGFGPEYLAHHGGEIPQSLCSVTVITLVMHNGQRLRLPFR
jgi:hypothetical protein